MEKSTVKRDTGFLKKTNLNTKARIKTGEEPNAGYLAVRESAGLRKLKVAAEAGKKGNYINAVKILRELISETDTPPEAWLLLGRSLHALKDYSHALAAFNDFIRQKPESGEGYLFIGRSYLTLGMPYKAVPFLRNALERSPGDSRTMALLGTAYLKSKHSRLQLQFWKKQLKPRPQTNESTVHTSTLST